MSHPPAPEPRPGSLPRELLKHATTSVGLRLLAVVFGFAFTVLLARRLGAQEAGLYLLAFNVISVLVIAGRLGLDHVVVRTVAGDRSEGNRDRVLGVVRTSTWLTGIAAGILSLMVWATAGWWASSVFRLPDLTAPLRVLSLAILPMALGDLWGFALRGLARIRESQWVLFVNSRFLNLVGLAVIGGTWGAVGIGWVTCVAAVAGVIAAGALLWRAMQPVGPARAVGAASLLLPGSTLFAIDLVATQTDRMSLLVLAGLGGSVDAGIFGTALRTAGLLSLALHAVDVAVAPRFAALHRHGDRAGLGHLARTTTRAITWATVPPVIGVVLWRDSIMGLFGEEFVGGSTALAILMAGQCVHAITGPAASVLVMSGREGVRLAILVATALVGIALNLVLIPAAGLVGAAAATALTWGVQGVLESAAVFKIQGFWLVANPFRLGEPGRPD